MKTTIDGIDHPIPAPHCDPQVLHAPGVCRYCDAHPKWQTKRTLAKMLFTGELPREGWQPCPAEKARGMDSGNAGPGNRPADSSGDALVER
jgi:hypothetical protein